MSAGNKKRLEDALNAGKRIEEEELKRSYNYDGYPCFTDMKEFKVGNESGVYSVQCNAAGNQVAVGLGSGGLQIFSVKTFERIRKLQPGSIIGLPITCLKYYPCITENVLFTASSGGSVSAWDMDNLRHKETINEIGNEICALDFTNDGNFFATTGKDKNIRIYHTEGMRLKELYHGIDPLKVESDEDIASESGHGQKVFALRFHPEDKDIFLTAGWDHSLKIWDIRTGGAVRTIHGPFVCGDGLDIAGNEILTASWLANDALQIWDYGSGKSIDVIPVPVKDNQGEYLYCGRFWDTQYVLVGGSGTNDLKLINRSTKMVVDELDVEQRPVQALDVNQKHKVVLAGTSSNLLKRAFIALSEY